MNRYVLAGAAALLILLGLSGLGGTGRRAQGNAQMPGEVETEAATLGNLPIEQAGQVVQRQGSGSGTLPTPMTNLDSAAGSGATAPTPPGATPNTVPPQSATPLPAPAGDISPVQPDLVRPDPLPPANDPALEAIPALW